MALIRGNGGLNITFYVRDPEKAHPCAEPHVLAYFAWRIVTMMMMMMKIDLGALAVASCKNPKKRKNGKKLTRFGAQSHACAETKPPDGS